MLCSRVRTLAPSFRLRVSAVQRWEQRERKKQADRNRMKKSGASVKVILRILGERATRAQATDTTDSPTTKTQKKPSGR